MGVKATAMFMPNPGRCPAGPKDPFMASFGSRLACKTCKNTECYDTIEK
jgi:ribosomal protein S27AE